MEELYELRRYIETGDTAAALALLDEMDDMRCRYDMRSGRLPL